MQRMGYGYQSGNMPIGQRKAPKLRETMIGARIGYGDTGLETSTGKEK